MIVHPYRETPEPPLVAVLADEGSAIVETGEVHDLDKLPAGIRVFAGWDRLDRFARTGVGEFLCWGEDQPIRWRHRRYGDAARRGSDVVVVKLPVPYGLDMLAGLVEWRDWLADYGATVGWSLGGTSMSLLRATLHRELVTTNGHLPPPRWTLGGRQQAAVEPGATVHGAVHLDLPAAYSTTVGQLRYGGVWRRLARPAWDMLELLQAAGSPVLVHGRVRLASGLQFGPLPRRPRKKPPSSQQPHRGTPAQPVPYPTSGRFQGLFTLEEVQAAVEQGCGFACDTAYVHVTGMEDAYPFAAWLDACREGRRAKSWFAALLAKATANALWGQFVIDDEKELEVQRWTKGGARQRLRVGNQHGGHQLRAWDLGEVICGRVRAKLYRMMQAAGPRLLTAHTDGGWIRSEEALPVLDVQIGESWSGAGEWAVKDQAAVIQILDQQKLRYQTPKSLGRWSYTFSGVPASQAPAVFERLWKQYERSEG